MPSVASRTLKMYWCGAPKLEIVSKINTFSILYAPKRGKYWSYIVSIQQINQDTFACSTFFGSSVP